MSGGPPPDSKLTTTKQAWAGQGRGLTGQAGTDHARTDHSSTGRLPPGQHLVTDWPVLDLGTHPAIDPARWTLRVFGQVEDSFHWTWDAFAAQPQVQRVTDIHCVTTWSRYDNAWAGVSTRTILDAARPKPSAQVVVLHSHDGYTTNLTLADFAAADAILAHSWNGAPLTREHGAPVRLVVPHLYLWKSAKWLQRIEFTDKPSPGFWETRGYHDRGDPWAEQRYSS